ncbi:MAG: putative alpha/beta-fold hydrolase [Saprospiraceae bacterium]|jgi:predicted alpha/beta-fold hydrolase
MPLIHKSSYPGAPFYQFTPHLQTILPALIRKVKGVNYKRERFTLSDGDFVDLDWIDKKSKTLALLVHGLEGSTDRHYMKGMAKHFAQKNWDVLAWNCRSCSGEMNLKRRLYHHGEIGDIEEVIQHAISLNNYEKIVLIGFSMGGNIIMKYLGVHGENIPAPVYKAVVFSAPLDLVSSVLLLDLPESSFYKKRFLKLLKTKIEIKAEKYPEYIDFQNFSKIEKWADFDNFFTAPLNGFKDATEFYHQGSAVNFMEGIKTPTLLVNAQNDPILTPECSPTALCESHKYIYLETPREGGHVGFMASGISGAWSEGRAWEFVNQGG